MNYPKNILAWLTVPLASCLVALAVEAPMRLSADWRFMALVAAIGSATLAAWLGGALIVRLASPDFAPWSALRLAFPAAFLTSGAALYLTLIESRSARFAIVLLLAVMLWAFVQNLRFAVADPAGGRARNFNNLACAVDAIGGFLLLAFLFGINDFVTVPVAVSVCTVGVAGGWVGFETLRRYGFEAGANWAIIVAFALYAAELQAALSFLPTAREIGAVIAVVAFALPLHVAVRTLAGGFDRLRVRRLVIAAVILAALMLLTASWR